MDGRSRIGQWRMASCDWFDGYDRQAETKNIFQVQMYVGECWWVKGRGLVLMAGGLNEIKQCC